MNTPVDNLHLHNRHTLLSRLLLPLLLPFSQFNCVCVLNVYFLHSFMFPCLTFLFHPSLSITLFPVIFKSVQLYANRHSSRHIDSCHVHVCVCAFPVHYTTFEHLITCIPSICYIQISHVIFKSSLPSSFSPPVVLFVCMATVCIDVCLNRLFLFHSIHSFIFFSFMLTRHSPFILSFFLLTCAYHLIMSSSFRCLTWTSGVSTPGPSRRCTPTCSPTRT